MGMCVWVDDGETSLVSGYEPVADASFMTMFRDVSSVAVRDRVGSMSGTDFVRLAADAGARFETLLVYEEDPYRRRQIVLAALEAGIAEHVLYSGDGGYSFTPAV